MVKAGKMVMQCFTTPEGQVIKRFLEECLADKDKECRVREGNDVYRSQGAALELEEIINLANNARDALESM